MVVAFLTTPPLSKYENYIHYPLSLKKLSIKPLDLVKLLWPSLTSRNTKSTVQKSEITKKQPCFWQ